MKPEFITFTGADDFTDVKGMRDLAEQYPIEWGILFSPSRQGHGRYPSTEFVNKVRAERGLRLAAHICGDHSDFLVTHGHASPFMTALLAEGKFARVQVNTTANVDAGAIARWANSMKITPILQCREAFPADDRVLWLLDASGGRGISPTSWARRPAKVLSGYAGGLGPANVASAVEEFSRAPAVSPYWIDMESKVRTPDDRFSLDLCQQVCEAVYRQPHPEK